MIVGDINTFAIESEIYKAYKNLGFRALGFFVVYIKSHQYGIREENATLLACAYDETKRRLQNRGKHIAPFIAGRCGGDIIDSIMEAVYDPAPKRDTIWGMPLETLGNIVDASQCEWHRCCDEAFDDGSCLLQFDVGDTVRLIANLPPKSSTNLKHDPKTLQDITIEATVFYNTLNVWLQKFEAEWEASPKS